MNFDATQMTFRVCARLWEGGASYRESLVPSLLLLGWLVVPSWTPTCLVPVQALVLEQFLLSDPKWTTADNPNRCYWLSVSASMGGTRRCPEETMPPVQSCAPVSSSQHCLDGC